MRYLVAILLILAVCGGLVFAIAGRGAPPTIKILGPSKMIGADATLDVAVETPKAAFSRIDIVLEQNGRSTPLFSLGAPGAAKLTQETPNRIRISRPIGKRALPDLQAGRAKIVVTAARTTLFGLRSKEASMTAEFAVRFNPPRVSPVSTHHYVNLGGSEMVVYRVSPPDVQSGVQVGDMVYPGYPASGAGVAGADPELRVAFFALLYDQDLATPIRLFARDEAGNESHASLDHKPFPKPFSKGRIELNDAFLQRVVPDILEHAPELKLAVAPGESYLPAFLRMNTDLRRLNAEKIVELSKQTAAEALWNGPVPRARQRQGRVEVRRLPDVLLRGEGSRSPGAPRVRPRGDEEDPGAGRQRRQGRVTPTSSASTATASSSTTAWACSRCTGTCRRST